MLLAAEIKSHCYGTTYTRGRDYYRDANVRKLDVEPEGDWGRIRVNGVVRGSGRKEYSVDLELSEEDEILNYDCTCPAIENYWGMCKHCVAVAMAYQEEQKKNRHQQIQDNPMIQRGTSEALRNMMAQYSMRNRRNRSGAAQGQIRLECFFQPDRKGLILECRIGDRRMYVIKNLVKLVRDVEEMRQVRYGAQLDFVHDLSSFTKESQELLNLLIRTVAIMLPNYKDYSYETSNSFRYLTIPSTHVPYFLDLYLGRTICLEEKDVPVVDGNPSLIISMKEILGGAEVESEAMEVYENQEISYVYKEGSYWRCTKEFCQKVLPIWKILSQGQSNRYRKQPLFLSREDYGSFCGNILPSLEPFVDIRTGGLNLADYAPADPEFSIYLEMPEDSVVAARAKVRYDEAVFDLLIPAEVGGVCRNPDREEEVTAALERYFIRKETNGQPLKKSRKSSKKRLELVDGLPVRSLDEEMEEGIEESMPETFMFAVGEDALYQLVEKGLDELGGLAELFVDDSIRKLQIQATPKVTMGIGLSGDLLKMDIQVDGMDPAEIAGILEGYRRRRKYYRLKNGDFIRLEDSGLGTLSELSEGLQLTEKQLREGSVELPGFRALYLENVLGDMEELYVRKSAEYRRLIRSMKTYTESEYELPEDLQAHLRKYQKEGYRWLCTLWDCGFGGILADDMGLGKTLQMIAMFLHVRKRPEAGPLLVVSPASLVYNWESELQRFAPSLSVQVIAGSAAERREQLLHVPEYAVNITSYDLLKRDVDLYEALQLFFDGCVLDEAQYIKNAGTQAAKAVKRVNAPHRFALTGTPIENRLSDLWSIFDFLMPGYLYTYNRFREELESPIVRDEDEVTMARLQKMVTPFLLRRRKQDVLKDLPDKLEENVMIRMTPEQERIYRASAIRLQQELASKDEKQLKESRIQILAELTRLRQLCCSPELCLENYTGGSGKVDTCMELLRNASEGGHRVLVFSQFTSMLELLQNEWKKTGGTSLYLSGKNTKVERRDMVALFQQGDIPVFFISLKAGGTGLNLTAADLVIHCDPWWNVAAQNQATDRAHRFGQKQVVTVMKLVAKGTLEEKIIRLQEKKALLADQVVEGEGVESGYLDAESLAELFEE